MQHRHLLVVDDEDLIREIVTLAFELTMGWQVTGASSGPEALKLAMALHPDAILLDLMMHDFDGPSTFRMLRSNALTRDIPVIFLSGSAHTIDAQKFMQMGVRGIVAKPFDPLSLPHQVRTILRWEQAA